MRSAHTVSQVRAAETSLMAALPPGALMARAAAGLAYAVIDLLGSAYGRRVLLLVGSGDNGGDALYAGALLARRGAQVSAVSCGSTVHAAGVAALRAAGGRVLAGDEAERMDVRTNIPEDSPRMFVRTSIPEVVVDGIAGIGGRPGLRDDVVDLLRRLEGIPVVAVDVPSGVEVDTGRLDGPHVRADVTVTFGTHKIAHLVDPAAEACGAVTLVDLGLDLPPADVTALQAADVDRLLPRPEPGAHKYTRGLVGVRAGSTRYPGAGVLCVAGAAAGLAGMVRYVGDVADQVRAAHPEVVAEPGRVQAWVVGSGGGDGAAEALKAALADGVPVVVDADALVHAGTRDRPPGATLVLTPHAGELARMLGTSREQVEADQLASAREAAERFEAVVVLKGRHSLTAAPDGRVRVTTTGLPWLATAGAGDVLAGLVGALLATGLDPFDAASVGSWLHGAAATLASADGPVTASDVARALPAAVRGLRESQP